MIETNNFSHYIINSKLDKLAVIDDRGSITYKELASKVRHFAGHLKFYDICPGDRVIMAMPDSTEWIIGFLGCMYIGAVPVMASPIFKETNLLDIINQTKAKAILSDLPNGFNIRKFTSVDVLNNDFDEISEAYQFHADEIAVMQSSSGTTGKHKLAAHRHQGYLNYNAMVTQKIFFDKESVLLATAKLFTSAGLNLNCTLALGSHATCLVTNKKLTQELLYQFITNNNVTHMSSSPGVLSMMSSCNASLSLPSIKYIFCASQALPINVFHKFKEVYGIEIVTAWGSTETMSWALMQSLDEPKGKISQAIGKPLDSVVCEVRKELGELCDINEIGELYINHPCAASYYWNDYASTKKTFQGPWVATGDLVYVNKNNDFIYVARKDDMVKINGIAVSILEVEQTVLQHPLVEDCVVNVSKNKSGLNMLETEIVPKEKIDVSEIRKFLAQKLEAVKIPKHIKFVSEISKTASGKNLRKTI